MKLMRRSFTATLSLMAASFGWVAAEGQAPPPPEISQAIPGVTASRNAHSDIALPRDSDEYDSLGKNAVLMIEANSFDRNELPISRTYVDTNGVKISLRGIASFPIQLRQSQNGERYFSQTTFYLLPVSLIKVAGTLQIDFKERRGFGISDFPQGLPSFLAADDYDVAGDPVESALKRLLIREYPTFFKAASPTRK
ncbi:MAG TPA: hypothetical protein VGL58_08485 [Caulobacteraceae bacterium]|jgi:hypothetical protein